MSLFHLAATTVVTAPVPSPAVVKQVVQQTVNVPVTPPAVIQLFQVLGLAAAGAVTSIIHLVLERGKWSGNVNRLVWALYSLIGGLAYAVLTGNLGSTATHVVAQFVGVIGMAGSSSAFYNLVQFLNQVLQNAQTTTPAPSTQSAQ